MQKQLASFNFIPDTVSTVRDLNVSLDLLKLDSTRRKKTVPPMDILGAEQ